ncbi:hypothetical protein SAMN05421743_105182 [Thalassobacillus cyri]|uniref:Sce7725 family protein n=1 Tax=Thalassobacillus cyri TaxID=571932 RepID=A0A1H4BWZ0_9BACI|nr:sce7725 family protein [Thalassobacillus cyri]SEA52658.1 hypothetical protein SAMN05421743_105182 [Thalassobacillus cyri]
MYFPYLYGKSNELHALNELVPFFSEHSSVIPIIEPLNDNKTTLNKLNSLSEAEIPYIFIINPQNGDLKEEAEKIDELLSELVLANVSLGYCITTETTHNNLQKLFNDYSSDNFTFIHQSSPNTDVDEIINTMNENMGKIDYQVFMDEQVSELYKRHFSNYKRVLMRDSFKKASKNAEFPNQSYFTDLHITYRPEYDGFGDFQMVGKELSESGGPAHAVALHLTTQLPTKEIVIQHFVSDDTEGAENPGGKYLQAVAKLVKFMDTNSYFKETKGSKDFRDTHERKHYPGLGMAKRFSIKHHIELLAQKL